MTALRIILGDQLSHTISCLENVDPQHDIILMCEVIDEATYVRHHKKKIAFLFAAMRQFAAELRERGLNVIYSTLDDPDNGKSFQGEIKRAITSHPSIQKIVATHPGEYRVLQDMQTWQETLQLPVTILPDTRFLCSLAEFATWANGRKQLRMEYFYREMRRKHHILMDGDEPIGGQWNFDAENRKPPTQGLQIPSPFQAPRSEITRDVLQMVAHRFHDHFGDLEPFHFATTRAEALQALRHFIDERLPKFGDYQDAMLEDEPWMYHAHLSFYLNCGLLLPRECLDAAERAYQTGHAPLNAVEGFIRQILGWREYIRGIYWLKMPGYAEANFLQATRRLPELYWTSTTHMNCLSQCVQETRRNAYAHHIQRLMVLGNFALLAGIDPKEVNTWFLVVYADAYEWVELPNVSGMILFADGGYLGSKPYAAGGGYIDRMSNYCQKCSYDVRQKTGPKACPFNYLYWDFLARNHELLKTNQRLSMMYATYGRMDEATRQAISTSSQNFLAKLDANDSA